MTDKEFAEALYIAAQRPRWWFKSNNWKRLHGYPMLHHQKKEKSKVLKKYTIDIFDLVEQEMLNRFTEKYQENLVDAKDIALGDACVFYLEDIK